MESEAEVKPEVSVEFKPKLGLEFDSLEDSSKMYNRLSMWIMYHYGYLYAPYNTYSTSLY
ncbi:unnamed protein product [Prunus armeniaca]|uniref:Uncharacterized protein n=1 Tax=Prunus armeniaca TaxID=36596 RepID=A0A6J5V590_PRUAR|nr:unnamed protein product [Prunus armeniaca]CAB4314773.1 unnamed protein product [Prunus armeniaca]